MLPPGEVLQRRPSIQDKLQHVVCIFLSNIKSNVQFNLEKFFFLDKPLRFFFQQMHRCVQTRRGSLRAESMPARAKPNR